MIPKFLAFTALAILILLFTVSCDPTEKDKTEADRTVSIVPYPKSVSCGKGSMSLKEEMVVIVPDEALLPYAEVFSENVKILTGKKPLIKKRGRSRSAIKLEIDPDLSESQYRIKIKKSVLVEAGSVKSLVQGCYSLLQLIGAAEEEKVLPYVEISDTPDSQYRGLLIDLARNWHDPATIFKLIDLAAFYKINFLQLHFTDHQSFTLPSHYMPQLSTENRHYTFEELKELEKYARRRGIAIVPELEIPGHAMAMVNANPELFGIKDFSENPYTINMGKEEVYQALEILINEIMDVFDSSPYFHIGGDEAIFHLFDQDPDVQKYMAQHKLGDDIHDLYRHFINRMNDIVKDRGKQMCVWEGFRKNGAIEISKDILVFEYETAFYLPCELIEDGYTVVNSSWKPLYVVNEKKWSPEYIYGWNMWRWENWFDKVPSYDPIQCQVSPSVIGGQMCAWEQAQELEFPSLRKRLPAFVERIWTAEKAREVSDFLSRLEITDRILSVLVDDATQDTLPAFDK